MSRRVPALAVAGLALLVPAAPAAAQTQPVTPTAPSAPAVLAQSTAAAESTAPAPAAATPTAAPAPRPRPEPRVIPSVLGPQGEILIPDPMRIVPDAVTMIFDNDDEEGKG
ncbi:MAG TPA: hypothetical protein VIL36_15870 [Acidimicrobiales bacterium]